MATVKGSSRVYRPRSAPRGHGSMLRSPIVLLRSQVGRRTALPIDLVVSILICLSVPALLIWVYVMGCAQVTCAGYETGRLTRELKRSQLSNQALNDRLIAARGRQGIEDWARANGMVRAQEDVIVVRPHTLVASN